MKILAQEIPTTLQFRPISTATLTLVKDYDSRLFMLFLLHLK